MRIVASCVPWCARTSSASARRNFATRRASCGTAYDARASAALRNAAVGTSALGSFTVGSAATRSTETWIGCCAGLALPRTTASGIGFDARRCARAAWRRLPPSAVVADDRSRLGLRRLRLIRRASQNKQTKSENGVSWDGSAEDSFCLMWHARLQPTKFLSLTRAANGKRLLSPLGSVARAQTEQA